jgi:hypothetical protein
MDNIQTHILLFFLPLIIGNVLHMVIVKKDLFSLLAIPISPKLFGNNKTVRGFVVLPLLTGFVAWVNGLVFGPLTYGHPYDFFVGAGLGMAYMIAELPNSYMKRRMGIQTGETVYKYKTIQVIIDKTDSLFGVLLFYYFAIPVSFRSIVLIFLTAIVIHFSLSYLLVVLKVKKSL